MTAPKTHPEESRVDQLLAALASETPAFHRGGRERWDVSPGTLRLIEQLVDEGDDTLEIGVGVSTALFAALGTNHQAISPAAEEFHAVRAWCAAHMVDTTSITFTEGFSDAVLPSLSRPVDCALIDGAHSFPIPTVDFHYVRRLVKVGGILILDDVPIPSVGTVYRFLRDEPNWSEIALADNRAVAFRLIAPSPDGDPWGGQRMNSTYPDFSFLPQRRHRALQVGAYLAHSSTIRRLRGRVPALQKLVPTAHRLLR